MVPRPTTVFAAVFLFRPPLVVFAPRTPLLEEEGRIIGGAPVVDFVNPCFLDRPCRAAALATNDHPVNAGQVNLADRPDKRLESR